MKLFRYIGFWVALCLVSFVLQGQTQPEQILKQAEHAVYGNAGSAVAEFTSSYYDAKGRMQSSVRGRMYLQGESFRLEYGHITAVYSGKTLTHYNSEEETLTISEPTAEDLLQINPLHFLRSRGKGYTMSLMPASKSAEIVRFVPKAKGEMKHLEISFARRGWLPSQAIVVGKDGSRMDIRVDNLRHLQAQPEDFFRLSAKQYPGCEVVDLR